MLDHLDTWKKKKLDISPELVREVLPVIVEKEENSSAHLFIDCSATSAWGRWLPGRMKEGLRLRVRRCLNCRCLNLLRWSLSYVPSYPQESTVGNGSGAGPTAVGQGSHCIPSPSSCPALCSWMGTFVLFCFVFPQVAKACSNKTPTLLYCCWRETFPQEQGL